MSRTQPPGQNTSTTGPSSATPQNGTNTYFTQQRELLVTEIAQSLETVLQSLNKLNRSLEEVTSVGAEFAPVEGLWSYFEGVMGNTVYEERDDAGKGEGEGGVEEDGEGVGGGAESEGEGKS